MYLEQPTKHNHLRANNRVNRFRKATGIGLLRESERKENNCERRYVNGVKT